MILEDDQGVFPAGNPIFVASQAAGRRGRSRLPGDGRGGPEGLTLPVMQELNARVDLDKEAPAAVATQYLQE